MVGRSSSSVQLAVALHCVNPRPLSDPALLLLPLLLLLALPLPLLLHNNSGGCKDALSHRRVSSSVPLHHISMCSRVWFVTDRRIHQEYPQVQILRALKERCVEEDVEFRSLLMDQIVLTISEGNLGKYLRLIARMLCDL